MRRKRISLALLCLAMLTASFCVPALANDVSLYSTGQERSFDIDLPQTYKNYYFTTRTKQTNDISGYVRVTSRESECGGITVWFCDENCSRKSNIVKITNIGSNNSVQYTSGYYAGANVRMGVEDYDNVILGNHNVKGVVNYK